MCGVCGILVDKKTSKEIHDVYDVHDTPKRRVSFGPSNTNTQRVSASPRTVASPPMSPRTVASPPMSPRTVASPPMSPRMQLLPRNVPLLLYGSSADSPSNVSVSFSGEASVPINHGAQLVYQMSVDRGDASTSTHLSIFDTVFQMLFLLQTRGYDSVGVCTLQHIDKADGQRQCVPRFIVSKYSVEDTRGYIFDALRADADLHAHACACIGHTRWATTGRRTNANAHPHVSRNGRIAVVHNGIIDNYRDLYDIVCHRSTFCPQGESDSEILPNLLAHIEHTQKHDSFYDVVQRVHGMLRGTWACLVMHVDYPDAIFFMKCGMPLHVSHGLDNKYVFVSDPSAYTENVRDYVMLLDDVCGYAHFGADARLRASSTLVLSNSNYRVVPHHFVDIDTFDTAHVWTLQNLDNMQETILNTQYEYLPRRGVVLKQRRFHPDVSDITCASLADESRALAVATCVAIVGCGTGLHVARDMRAHMQAMEVFEHIDIIDACQFTPYDLPRTGTVYVFVNQSSENRDLEHVRQTIVALQPDARVYGVFNNAYGPLAIHARAIALVNAGKDFAFSFVKSYVAQFCTLYVVMTWIKQQKKMDVSAERAALSFLYGEYVAEHVLNVIKTQHEASQFATALLHAVAERKTRVVYVVCSGTLYAVGCEIAMKMRDVAGVHAHACTVRQARYGFHGVLDASTPVLFLVDKRWEFPAARTLLQEATDRGAPAFVIANDTSYSAWTHISVPDTQYFLNLSVLLRGLYVCYFMALHQGIHPDRLMIHCRTG